MAEGIVVVTGGSRGIGAEIAVESARAGNDVVIGFADPKKQKRANEVIERVEALGMSAIAYRGDLTDHDEALGLLGTAQEFAAERGKELRALVLNAAGGLESGATEEHAYNINSLAPFILASNFLISERRAGHTALTKQVVYVTSNPSHFYEHPENVMPSEVYDIVAASKHDGEGGLRRNLEGDDFGIDYRLLVATADLVDDTAGATLLRLAHRRAVGDRSADLLAERDAQLQGLIGRGITNAVEFGSLIVGMFSNETLPHGHTLYVPRPVLGEYVVPPAELPFNLSQNPLMYTFAQ
jgi:3-oxoacyl-[acyl-carrier protein] reductase